MAKYTAKLRIDRDILIENYLENSGCSRGSLPRLDSGEIDYTAIIETEVGWLDSSAIKIFDIEEDES